MEIDYVSDNLSKDEIDELSSYYNTYKRKVWAYKQHKFYKRRRFFANTASLIIASSSIATSTIFLPAVAITSLSLLIQSYVKYKDYDHKIKTSLYAYQTYAHLLTKMRNILRCGDFERESLLIEMNVIDDFIIDNTCVIDKWYKIYDDSFAAGKLYKQTVL